MRTLKIFVVGSYRYDSRQHGTEAQQSEDVRQSFKSKKSLRTAGQDREKNKIKSVIVD